MNPKRYYTTQHPYYCGVDLHARSLFVCILDPRGDTKLSKNLPATPAAFFDAIVPFREGHVGGVGEGIVGMAVDEGVDLGRSGRAEWRGESGGLGDRISRQAPGQ